MAYSNILPTGVYQHPGVRLGREIVLLGRQKGTA